MTSVLVPQKRKIGSLSTQELGQTTQINESDETLEDGEIEDGEIVEDIQTSFSSRNQSLGSLRKAGYASVDGDHHLCKSCSDIDFTRIEPGPRNWTKTALPRGRLSEFTRDADCLLCQLFSSMASRAYAPVSSGSQSIDDVKFYLCAFYTSAMYGHNWRKSRTLPGLLESVSFAIVDEQVLHDRDDSFTKERKMFHNLWESRTAIQRSGWISPAQGTAAEKRFSAAIIKQEADFDVIKKWLDFCLKHHRENCEPVDLRPIHALQVVDCDTGLIITAEPGCKYLALSYVWGQTPSEEPQSGEEINLLGKDTPNLIKDAMAVTKRLRYQYLWVDRYCIPQQDNEERHSQIQQMDLVYSKAQATIIAIASVDPSHGLPGVGSRSRAPSVTINVGNNAYAYVPPDPTKEILSSAWNSRGWTHQETILSRRRIFFCNHQVYFECAGMRCYDSMNAPLEMLHTKDLKTFSKWNRPGLFSRVRQTKYPLDAVFDHITEYTRRNLTRPEDILNGIMGTFHAFESTYDSFRHYWGIPMVPDITNETIFTPPTIRKSTRTEQFLTGLCWYLSEPGKRRPGFPSWSWAGWYGRLKPHSENNGYIDNIYGVKVWIDSIFTSQMDLGTFCETSTTMELFPKNPKPYICIEAAFLRVRLKLLKSRKGVEGVGIESNWEVVIKTSEGREIFAPFYLTRHTAAGDELHTRLLEDSWSAFVLGDRLKTRYVGASATKRRVLSSQPPHVMLVVVDELGDMIERVGIIEFDDPRDRQELEYVPKEKRIVRYG